MIEKKSLKHFLSQQIEQDLTEQKIDQLCVRFPPEPNGYLHIGHVKAICLNFGLAQQFSGKCFLRFDDTNPAKEAQHYIDAIKEDIQWLGFQWTEPVRYTSDYFDLLYAYAIDLIEAGDAYVCSLTADQADEYKGNFNRPGKNSPYRDRSIEENLVLFTNMKAAKYKEGTHVLRAKIDMQSPNMNLRDPVLYRIRYNTHHQTGDKWCIYPSYDFAHGQADAIEGVTHSICTLEFEDHRPLYDWLISRFVQKNRPKQYEFSRLHLSDTVTSKRVLKSWLERGWVSSWDDPRMPTVSGLRRRGVTAQALQDFCHRVGVSRSHSVIDKSVLDQAVRMERNQNAPRAFCVMNPLKVVIENLAEDYLETWSVPYHPEKELGQRDLFFTREIYIDEKDFKKEYSKKFKKKWSPGKRIRLRYGYVLECTSYDVNSQGEVICVYAQVIEHTLGADPQDGNKPKGVVHWLSVKHSVQADIRRYDQLFLDNQSSDAKSNVRSIRVMKAIIEPLLAKTDPESSFQFEREGYFVADRFDHSKQHPVFNLTVGLREDRVLMKEVD